MDSDGEDQESTFLNDAWKLYFHAPADPNWNDDSYTDLGRITTIEEYALVQQALTPGLHQGMFFLFREDIRPVWNDPANIDGCCLSMKVLKGEAAKLWVGLASRLLGESLLKPQRADEWAQVCGISISPKRSFCILKVWLGSEELGDAQWLQLAGEYNGDVLYKSNRDNISNDHIRAQRTAPPARD